MLDPREEGPAFRAVYLDGRRYLSGIPHDEAKLWTRGKRVPGRLTCGFLRLGVGTIWIPYTEYIENYNFKLLLEYLSICYYEL